MNSPPLPPAVVLNLFGTGLGIARNLGRRGVRVVGVSSREDAPGNASRFARGEVGPDSQDEPEALAHLLLGLAGRIGGRAVLFPTRDADILFLDRHRDVLAPHFALAIPERHVLLDIMDKERLARLAEAAGVDTPRTVRIGSPEELEAKRAAMRYPAVLKPVYANDWRKPGIWQAVGGMKGIRVETHEACRDAYAKVARSVPEALVQEWIPGAEDEFHVLGVCTGSDGAALGSFTARKLLQYPPGFGLGCLVRAADDPEVRDLGLTLLRAARFRGIAEVEFKRDARTGRLRLIEVNPRHWDQHNLGTACGVNLSWLAYRDLCGLPRTSEERPIRNAYWIHGGGIVGCLKEAVRRRAWSVLRDLAPVPFSRRCYAFWDLGDRGPALEMLRSRRGKTGRRIVP